MPSSRQPAPAPTPLEPRRPTSAREWAREALLARRDGDIEAAVECARRAVRLAPFHQAYRDLFTQLLYDKLDPRGAGQAVEDADIDLDDMETPPAAPAGERPRRGGSRGVPMMFDVAEDEAPTARQRAEAAVGALRSRLRPRPAQVGRASGMRYANAVVGGLLALAAAVSVAAGATWLRSRTAAERELAARSMEPEIPREVRAKLDSAAQQVARAPSEAVQILRTARSQFPEHSDRIDRDLALALGASARASLEKGQQTVAIEALKDATRLNPLAADLWFGLGEAYRERARVSRSQADAKKFMAEAEQAYLRALERDATLAAAHLGLGTVYQFRGDTEKARAALGTAKRLADPRSREADLADKALASLDRKKPTAVRN